MKATLTVVASGGGVPTVILLEALTVLPPESVTEAVMVWLPSLRVVEKLPPLPICPSISEVYAHPKKMAMY